MSAGIAFSAAVFLSLIDAYNARMRPQRVRSRFADSCDLSDDEFVSRADEVDRAIAIRIRTRLAEVFDLPPTKIQLQDPLKWYWFNEQMPAIYWFVFSEAMPKDGAKIVSCPKGRLETVGDLVAEAKALGISR